MLSIAPTLDNHAAVPQDRRAHLIFDETSRHSFSKRPEGHPPIRLPRILPPTSSSYCLQWRQEQLTAQR